MDPLISSLREDVDEHDIILRGDGNGRRGLSNRVNTLEENQKKVMTMLEEWRSFKDQVKGAKFVVIAVGVILTLLGGGLGVAILTTLAKIAESVP